MGPFSQILIFSYPPFRLVKMPKNRGNGTGAGLTPFRRKTFLRTKPRFSRIFGGWTQFSNLLDGLEGAENLRFQGPCEIQIVNNFGRSGVPRELHTKTLLVRKVCWTQFTAVWYKPRVLSKTNRRALQKCDNQVFEQKKRVYINSMFTLTLKTSHGPAVEWLHWDRNVQSSDPGVNACKYAPRVFLLKWHLSTFRKKTFSTKVVKHAPRLDRWAH